MFQDFNIYLYIVTINTIGEQVMSESTLYYFYSVGCGWCKKAEPIVDELNEAGYDILKLDLSEKDNQELNNQLKQKYGKQCGTPWLIDASSGNNICGFREKDIIKNGQKVKKFQNHLKRNLQLHHYQKILTLKKK